MSGANQYSVRPLALVSRFTPPSLRGLQTSAPVATGCVFGVATATPSSASATTEAAAIGGNDPAAQVQGSGRAGAAARASAANAATSMIPATIPAVVRTSVKPNRPNQIDSR